MAMGAGAGSGSVRFRLVDEYMGIRLGFDLGAVEPGPAVVVESERRLRPELSYGFVHALWWLWLDDGRSVVSVPPGAGRAVRDLAQAIGWSRDLLVPATAERLRAPVDQALADQGLPATSRVLHDLAFACDAALLRRPAGPSCARLRGEDTPPAEGLSLPTHCFPDGVAYGAIVGGHVVSVAYAHRSGALEDRVADLGVETAPTYRGRGFGAAAVAAVVGHFAATGGEARYACDPANAASVATALTVGFTSYGTSLILAAEAEG